MGVVRGLGESYTFLLLNSKFSMVGALKSSYLFLENLISAGQETAIVFSSEPCSLWTCLLQWIVFWLDFNIQTSMGLEQCLLIYKLKFSGIPLYL